MNILLVEDDEFKANGIISVVNEVLPEETVQRAMSVTSALRAITTNTYKLIILDMSLPTFELSGPGGGGSPQGQGGIEVLRLAKRLNNKSKFIVVTQYPDIEIDGRDVPLASAARALEERFGLIIQACLLYEFDGDAWRTPLKQQVSINFLWEDQ